MARLPRNHRPAVVADLAQRLATIQYDKGIALDFDDLWALRKLDDLLPEMSESIYETDYVGYSPLGTFFRERLLDLVADQFAYEPGAAGRLVDRPGFDDPNTLAERLVKEFESLPNLYMYTLPLPEGFPDLLGSAVGFVLGGGVQVVRTNAEFADLFPLTHSNPVRAARLGGTILTGPAKWDTGRLALQCTVKGYVGPISETAPLRVGASKVRSVLGLLVTMGPYTPHAGFSRHGPGSRVYVHSRDGDHWNPTRSLQLNGAISDTLANFGMEAPRPGSAEGVEAADVGLRVLRSIRPAFEEGEDAARVQLAAKWLFDGYLTEDLLAFVQTMVCLEILLGQNSKEETVGGAIRSRCAYLIGTSQVDREAVTKSLSEAYRIRSNIVHTGKDALTAKEQVRLYELRHICSRVIRKEMELLRAASS